MHTSETISPSRITGSKNQRAKTPHSQRGLKATDWITTASTSEEYSQPPYDGRLRFTKALAVSAFSHSA
jgi:hypothetical protein